MCRGELSLTTFEWGQTEEEPILDTHRPVHSCVDWEMFTESLKPRVVSEEELLRLKNPNFKSGRERN